MLIGVIDNEREIIKSLSKTIVNEHPEFKIVFYDGGIDNILDEIKKTHIDVLIVEVSHMHSRDVLKDIYDSKYSPEIIAVCDRDGGEFINGFGKYGVEKVFFKPLTQTTVTEIVRHIEYINKIKEGETELRRRVGSVNLTNDIYSMIKDGNREGIHDIVFPSDIRYKEGGAIKSYEIFLINILCFFLKENGYEDVFDSDIFTEMLNLDIDEKRMNYVMDKYSYVIKLIKNKEDHSFDDNRIIKAKRYIDNHYGSPELSCDFLAERSGMSARHFRRLFVKIYGVGVQEYIMNIRFDKAKKLLKETVLPIEAIIAKVGYNSSRYFRKHFKDLEGVTMSEYRKGREPLKL